MYGKKKKKLQKIETVEEYIELIKNARDPPFQIVRDTEYEVKYFELKIKKGTDIPKEFQISKVVRIDYFPNGTLHVFEEYDKNTVNNFVIESSMTFDKIRDSELASYVGISTAKVKD